MPESNSSVYAAQALLVDALLQQVIVPPTLPSPMGEFFDHDPQTEDRRNTVEYRAQRAIDRLVRLGASTDDLYDVARCIRALAIFDTLVLLDEGPDQRSGPPWVLCVDGEAMPEVHGEFWYSVDLLGRP